MTWYSLLRVAHSYWRWPVLIAALIVLVRTAIGVFRRREWTGADDRASKLFLTALDMQFTIGVILYFGFSPFFSAVYHSFSETMKDQGARFFGIEHQTAMLVASVVSHAGATRAKKAVSGPLRHRTMLIAMILFFAIVAWAIPWPSRPYGRPLFRTTW